MVKVHYMNLTNQECIMKNPNKIISSLAVFLISTFIFVIIVLIPYLNNVWIWIAESILISWLILTIIFLVIFNKFNKKQKEKGS